MQLPSHLRENETVLKMMGIVWDKRATVSRRRNTAAHRLELCEEHLEHLRHELLDADRDLAQVEKDVVILRNIFVQTSALNGLSEGQELYLSDVDDNSTRSSNVSA